MAHLPLAQGPVKIEVDLKANGEVSRMRSHKGERYIISVNNGPDIDTKEHTRQYAISPADKVLRIVSSEVHPDNPFEQTPSLSCVFDCGWMCSY
jgi:hypothetical protein